MRDVTTLLADAIAAADAPTLLAAARAGVALPPAAAHVPGVAAPGLELVAADAHDRVVVDTAADVALTVGTDPEPPAPCTPSIARTLLAAAAAGPP